MDWWGTSLLPDEIRNCFRHRSACSIPAGSRQDYLAKLKEYIEPYSTTGTAEEQERESRVLSTDYGPTGGGTEQGSDPAWGNCLEQKEKHLWLEWNRWSVAPKWYENQTVLAPSHTYPRQECWSPGRVQWLGLEFRGCGAISGQGCCWLQRDGSRGWEGGDCGCKACGGSHGSKAILLGQA